jgi:hypothetical protein
MARDFGRKRASLCALAAACFALLLWTSVASGLELRVHDNHLVDARGKVIRLLGVNRSGAEYACIQGYGFFDGPTDRRSIRVMKSWHINAVRVPLNEDCWLGINGVKPEFGAAAYRQAIEAFVGRLNRAGLYVILDLHVAAPGSEKAVGIIPLPDADHAPDFWRSVAATFASNHSLAFDLYNEPHDVGWDCWLRGCMLPAGGEGSQQHPAYGAAGMQDLVVAVRSTGAQQPLMAGGRGYVATSPAGSRTVPSTRPSSWPPPSTTTAASPPVDRAASRRSSGSRASTRSSLASSGRPTAATATSIAGCPGPTATGSRTSDGPGTRWRPEVGPAAAARA